MSSAASEPVLTASGPADLICAVPYLLGFHPKNSLVIVGLDGTTVAITVRLDLGLAVDDPDSINDSLDSMRRGGAERFIMLIFDDAALPDPEQEALPWHHLAGEVVIATLEIQAELADVFLVAGGRYWSYLCYRAGCCPDEGTVVSEQESQIPARATYAGLVALPDRDSVARHMQPDADDVRAQLAPAIDGAWDRAIQALTEGREAWLNRSDTRALFAAARNGLDQLDEQSIARFAVALRRIEVRDAVWLALDDGRLSGDELWRYLARTLPAPYDAAPCFLVGWVAWRRGNGTVAQVAAERAVRSDPGYSAADLLAAALAGAVDPRSLPKIRRPGRRYGRSPGGPG